MTADLRGLWLGAGVGPRDGRADDAPGAVHTGEAVHRPAESHAGDAIGHAGDVPGFSSFLAWIPRLDLSVVVLCNLSNLADKRAPATIVGNRIIEALRAPRDQR